MGIKIQIIEENKPLWDIVKYKIETLSRYKVQFSSYYASVEESVGAILLNRPDILIADLHTLRQYDLDTMENLLFQNKTKPKVIILASPYHMDGMQRIIEIGIFALVMKPIDTDHLARALDRAIPTIEQEKEMLPENQFITFRSNRSSLYVNQHDILFIESNRNICTLTLKDGTQRTVNESISSIEQRLQAKELLRVDKSTIINLSKVIYLGEDKYNKECRLKLKDGKEITKQVSKVAISRLYKIVTNVNSAYLEHA